MQRVGRRCRKGMLTEKVAQMAKEKNAEYVIICAEIESQIAQLGSEEEKKEFLESMGLTEPGLNKNHSRRV